MRKTIIFVLILAVLILIGLKLYQSKYSDNFATYNELIDNVTESQLVELKSDMIAFESVTHVPDNISLTDKLTKGIRTSAGVVKIKLNDGISTMYINNKMVTEIVARSPIDLIHLFAIDNNQIFFIAYNQGGNECAVKYQFVTIRSNTYQVSNLFGNCLNYKKITQNESTILIELPNDSQYAMANDLIVYKYQDGIVTQITKNHNDAYYLKHHGPVSARQILDIAIKDGCATKDGLNYDNSCGWGKKYCGMFFSLKNPVVDNYYKMLKDFCEN